jgi:hypothetical protein
MDRGRPLPVSGARRSRSRSSRHAARRAAIRDREAQLNEREGLLNRREAQVEKEERDVRKARTLHLEAVRRWDEYMEAREKSLWRREKDFDFGSPAPTEPAELHVEQPPVEVVSASESEHSAQRPNW